MARSDDGALVRNARAGDRAAFGELVRLHGPAMHAVSQAYFASHADAEDAVQEAFLKAYRHLAQLADDTRFASWLTRITINTCLNILAARTDKVSLDAFASGVQLQHRLGRVDLTPATLAGKDEEARQLRAAIGRLPEPQRVTLMLRYVEDMTYEQIADYLGVPASTVRGRLHSARQTLRGLFDAPKAN
jgi:RNA polymerase sigma-70 factor (ECF subfamily)